MTLPEENGEWNDCKRQRKTRVTWQGMAACMNKKGKTIRKGQKGRRAKREAATCHKSKLNKEAGMTLADSE